MSAARPVNKWIVAGTVLTGSVMAVLDSSIINVALPHMSGTLGTSIEEITWVVTSYILANVIIMPIIALLSARYGRKNFYLFSTVLFTVSSMLCGIARTLPVMVLFRVTQGIGGGVLLTVAQAILRESFPAEEQGLAMGLYGMGVVLAPAIGPTLGGWLTDSYSWPWIFYINVPVGVVNVLLVKRFIHDPPYLIRHKGKIDFFGLGLMAVGLGALQLMLEKGQQEDWFDSQFIQALAAAAVFGLVLFVVWELSVSRPAVNLRILKDAGFTSATALGGVLGMGLNASLFLLPVFLQNLMGYPAMNSGLALMPRSLAMAVVMPIAGRFYNELGPKLLVGVGLVVSAYSFWALGQLTSTIGFWDIFFPQIWQGVGFSLIFVALSTAALANIERSEVTAATGLYNVVRQVFGSVGVAIGATELTSSTVRYHAVIASHLAQSNTLAQDWLRKAGAWMLAVTGDPQLAQRRAVGLLEGKVLREAAVLAYNHVFALITALFVLSLPLVALLRRADGHVEVELAAE